MNKSTLFLVGVFTLLLSTPMSAQKLQLRPYNPLQAMPKMLPAEKAAKEKQFKANYPLVFRGMDLDVQQAGLAEVRPVVPFRSIASAAGIASGSASSFWAYVRQYDGWPTLSNGSKQLLRGVYEFTPNGNGPYALDSLVLNGDMCSTGGAAVVDGIYYKYFIDKTYISVGLVRAKLYSYDVSSWEPTATSGEDMSDHLDMYAKATCQSSDGTVYGEFFTSDLQTLEYGIVDYKAKTRSVIGTATKDMVAMGIAADGTWYGVASDGNFYTINKETGAETLVGATGMTLEADGSYYQQTGTIDPKTNIFYWYALDANAKNGGIYTVDLTTGAATKVADFVGGQAQLYDIVVAGKMAEDGAPAKATNLAASFVDGSTSGTVSFTAPLRNYADDANLAGTLRYAVTINKDTLASGTCQPGAAVSAAIVAPEGQCRFVVVTSNAAGVSPKASVSTYVGFDTPKAPASVTTTWASDNASATVSWDPVSETLHGGFLGPVSYEVVRLMGKDSTVVAEATSSTSLTDSSVPADGEPAKVRYIVRAMNGRKYSAWTGSDGHIVGSAFSVPYYEDFDYSDDADFFTIIDANKDGKTWKWNQGLGVNPYMRVDYNADRATDDWLITPPIKFKGGREYNLSFKSHGNSIYTEKMEVKFGAANTVSGMTNTIIPVTEITSDTVFENLSFTPSADGIYYVGFHGCSDKNMFWTKVDSIDIQASILLSSPAAPELSVLPDAKGALSAAISVKAPTKAVDGSNLSADHLSKIVLRRDYEPIHTFTSPAPGAVLTYTDNAVPADGYHTYSAMPYDGDDYGKKAETEVYVGQDLPKTVQNAKAFDEGTSIHITWDAPTEEGANGGYVDPANIKTLVWSVANGYLNEVLDTLVNTTSYDIPYNTSEGKHDLAHWVLQNLNRAGKSSTVAVALPVGTPYTLPFVESAAGGKPTNDWWIGRQGGTTYNNMWAYVTDDAADGDGGSFVYKGTEDAIIGSMNSYKIDLGTAANPTLVFSFNVKNSTQDTRGKLQVEVQTIDGNATLVYASDEFVSDEPWTRHTVDLSPYAGKVIFVNFYVYCQDQPVTVGLDDIRIQETYAHDLAVGLSAPESVIKGQSIPATIKVTNEGRSSENAFTVRLYADDAEVETIDVTDELGSFCDTTFVVSVPTSALPANKTEKVLKAKVILDADQQSLNNEATATVATMKSELPMPENLAAADAHPHVRLSWDAPSVTSVAFTEDFESYAPFAVDASGRTASSLGGGWTTIDGQAGKTPAVCLGQFWNDYTYPGQGKPGSFTIFNADAVVAGTFSANAFMHGHNDSYQFAAMPYEVAGNSYADGDNYLVSPALTGEAQTVSFYAKNASDGGADYPERFELLYSSAGNAKEDFTHVAIADTTLKGGGWQYFEAQLPAEATYFAIHQTSDASGTGDYLFSVDDVTFLKGIAPAGYNVYCDGTLIGHVDDGGTLEFYGDAPDGMHEWSVTATYTDGQESEPVSVTAATDISSIVANGEPFDVYTLDGILVRSQAKDVKGLKTGVYIINNKKIIIL